MSPMPPPPSHTRHADTDWLALAVHTARVAVGVSELHSGVLVDANDAFCRLYRYRRDEVIGRRSAELDLWPDPRQRERLFELLLRHGQVDGFAARYRNRLGETGDLEISARIVHRDGEPFVMGFLSDVTDRMELLEGLRAAQGRLGVVLRSSRVLVFAQDLALRYTWVANPALGATEDELLGRSDDDILGPEAAAPLVAIKRGVLASGRPARRDVWVDNQGRRGCFDLVVEPERDAAGRVVGIVCAAFDITHRMGAAAVAAPQPPAGAPLPPREQLQQRHAGAQVLVVEHNPVLRQLVAALLEQAGLQVVQATSGVQALSLAVQLSPALLLLDMELPQRGGVAAARAIRTLLARRVPVVAMITAATPREAALALDADLDDVIGKPVVAEQLYPRVLAWLDNR